MLVYAATRITSLTNISPMLHFYFLLKWVNLVNVVLTMFKVNKEEQLHLTSSRSSIRFSKRFSVFLSVSIHEIEQGFDKWE